MLILKMLKQVNLLLGSDQSIKLCSPPCLSAYKFGNGVKSAPCDLCAKEMDLKNYPHKVIHFKGLTKLLCSQVKLVHLLKLYLHEIITLDTYKIQSSFKIFHSICLPSKIFDNMLNY